MSLDVFISYARASSREQARLIAAALKQRGVGAFLDEREIVYGQRFPRDLAEALRQARIILVLLSEEYLASPWCAFELRVALAPYRSAGADLRCDHIVFGLPDNGGVKKIVPHLPPRLAQTNWPRSSDTAALADMVATRLQQCEQPVGELLEGLEPKVLDSLGSGGQIPIPAKLAPLTGWYDDLPPSLYERFRGREAELWSLFHLLQIGELTEGKRSCVISGGAGMGKTQLAAEFVHRYAPIYYHGGLVWIDAGNDERIASPPWREVLRGLNVTEFPADATAERVRSELSLAVRNQIKKGPLLWVVDNIPEVIPGKMAPSLDRWCPVRNLVTLVCTSRQPGITGCQVRLELGETDVDDSVLILTDGGVARDQLEEHQWKHIARRVGHLPLALRILNASLVESFSTPSQLYSALETADAFEKLNEEFETLVSECSPDSFRGIVKAFDFSFDALRSSEATLAAALRIARLAPVPIPDPLLASITDRRVLGRLKTRHWLLGEADGRRDVAHGRWRMHRLAASYLRSKSIDPPGELGDLIRSMANALTDPELLRQVPSSRLLTHILAVLSDFAQVSADKVSAEHLAAARDLILACTFFRLEDNESDDLRSFASSFACRFGVDCELVQRLEEHYARGDPKVWPRLLPVLNSLSESRAAVPLLLRLLQDERPYVQRAALSVAGFHMAQDKLAMPCVRALLAHFPADALYSISPLRTEIMQYFGSDDPFWELADNQDIRNTLELFSRQDRFPPMLDVLKPLLTATQPGEELGQLLDGYVLCLRAHYTPLPFRVYTAGRWDPIEESYLGGYTEFHPPSAREVDDAHFAPLVKLILASPHEETVRHTARLLATFVQGTDALSQAAHKALETGRPERALLVANQTLELRQDFANGWWWRALALEDMQQEDLLRDVLASYGHVVDLAPKFADARVRHATLALKLGEFERCIRSARVLAKLEPENGLAHHLQACAFLNLKQPRDAAKAASEAVRLAPHESEAWLFRALAHEQLEERNVARADAERAADLNPDDPRPRECLSRLSDLASRANGCHEQ